MTEKSWTTKGNRSNIIKWRAVKRVEEALAEFTFPMLLVTATPGAIIKPDKVEWLKKTIKRLTVADIGAGIHYLQEDNPKASRTQSSSGRRRRGQWPRRRRPRRD